MYNKIFQSSHFKRILISNLFYKKIQNVILSTCGTRHTASIQQPHVTSGWSYMTHISHFSSTFTSKEMNRVKHLWEKGFRFLQQLLRYLDSHSPDPTHPILQSIPLSLIPQDQRLQITVMAKSERENAPSHVRMRKTKQDPDYIILYYFILYYITTHKIAAQPLDPLGY